VWNRVQIETSDSIKLLLVINENLVEICEKNKMVQEKLHQRAVIQLIQYDNLRDLKINVNYAEEIKHKPLASSPTPTILDKQM
jgi:hypothetical protein